MRLEENTEEILSVALLSPACLVLMSHICFRFLLSLLVFFDVSLYIALSTIPNCIRFQLLVWQQLVWPATSIPFIFCFGICQHFFFGVGNDAMMAWSWGLSTNPVYVFISYGLGFISILRLCLQYLALHVICYQSVIILRTPPPLFDDVIILQPLRFMATVMFSFTRFFSCKRIWTNRSRIQTNLD